MRIDNKKINNLMRDLLLLLLLFSFPYNGKVILFFVFFLVKNETLIFRRYK